METPREERARPLAMDTRPSPRTGFVIALGVYL